MYNLKNGEITRKYHGFVEVGLLLPVSLSADKIASCATCCSPLRALPESCQRHVLIPQAPYLTPPSAFLLRVTVDTLREPQNYFSEEKMRK